MPRGVEQDLPGLDAVLAEAKPLHEGGYEATENWDLSQICRHMAMPNDDFIDGVFIGDKIDGSQGQGFHKR